MLKLVAKPFHTQKAAESLDDCQDAWDLSDEKTRYAIADGVTRSFFPKDWADLLVKRFCESADFSLFSLEESDWRDWIAPVQKKWYEQVEEKVNERNLFYLTNSFNTQESAVSTFIGIEFNKDNGGWGAMIVGDSCLFHKSDSGFESYLIENSADFTNRPEVFASFAKDNHAEPSFRGGKAKPGDTFILATDALAKWILEHKETGKLDAVLDTLEAIETPEQFCQFVDKERHNEFIRLVNDDVTLMLISVEEAQEQLNNQEVEQHASVEDTEPQSKFSIVFLLAMVTVFFGFAAFCYMLIHFFNRD